MTTHRDLLFVKKFCVQTILCGYLRSLSLQGLPCRSPRACQFSRVWPLFLHNRMKFGLFPLLTFPNQCVNSSYIYTINHVCFFNHVFLRMFLFAIFIFHVINIIATIMYTQL